MTGSDRYSEAKHPDAGRIEAVRTGEGEAGDAAHVLGCVTCLRTLENLRHLATQLRDAAPFPVPDEIDQRILWIARQQAGAVRRRQARRTGSRQWWDQRWVAAAVVVLSLGALSVLMQLNRDAVPSRLAFKPTDSRDVDGNGRVDILDAFALARALGGAPGAEPADVNGDGNVDQHDVDALARAAVSLGGA